MTRSLVRRGLTVTLAFACLTSCIRVEHAAVGRQPLAADRDSGIALITDGGIAAVGIRDLSGAVTDSCRPMIPTCDLEREAAPWSRTAGPLQTPFGEAQVVLLAMPPGRYRVASVVVYEGSGTRRIPLAEDSAPAFTVPPHTAVLLGEIACPGYRWRSCTPVWRGSLAAKRKTIDVLKWETAERRGGADDLTLKRSWIPRLDASYIRLTQEP